VLRAGSPGPHGPDCAVAYRGPMPWFKKSSEDPTTPAPDEDPGSAGSAEVEALRDDEVEWVRTTVAALGEQDVRAGDIDDLGRHYDELLTGWLRLREADRPDPETVITQIGLAFGQYVADRSGLSWGVATDPQGVKIVLHRPERAGQVLLYPTNMVAERWLAHETRILPALARATIDSVGTIA
jgi:hypothetical protein